TTVSGQKRLVGGGAVPEGGECAQATHVVTAVSVGAFVLSAGGEGSEEANADVKGLGAGGKRSRSSKIVRSAGDAAACSAATPEGPSPGCSSPIQVFLSPIPGRAEEIGPPGTVKVDFESESASTRWDAYVDDQPTCTHCSAPERRPSSGQASWPGRSEVTLLPWHFVARRLRRSRSTPAWMRSSRAPLGPRASRVPSSSAASSRSCSNSIGPIRGR